MDPLPSDLGYEGAVFEAFPLLRFSLMKIVNHCHQFHKLTDCIFAINVACRHVPLLCSNFCYSFLVMVVCYDSYRNFVVNLHFSNFISSFYYFYYYYYYYYYQANDFKSCYFYVIQNIILLIFLFFIFISFFSFLGKRTFTSTTSKCNSNTYKWHTTHNNALDNTTK